MIRFLKAGLTALALTSASTAPLQAKSLPPGSDAAQVLFGVAAVAVIGAALETQRTAPLPEAQVTPVHHIPRPGGITPRASTNSPIARGITPGARYGAGSWSGLGRAYQHRHAAEHPLPDYCLSWVDTRFGSQQIYSQDCIAWHYPAAHRLPDRCAVRLFSTTGPREGYDPLCLRAAGFRSYHWP